MPRLFIRSALTLALAIGLLAPAPALAAPDPAPAPPGGPAVVIPTGTNSEPLRYKICLPEGCGFVEFDKAQQQVQNERSSRKTLDNWWAALDGLGADQIQDADAAIQRTEKSKLDEAETPWKTSRDLANILFILVLSAIAFSSLLRRKSQAWRPRRLLPRLILVIVAVNFTYVVAEVVINFTNVMAAPFVEPAQQLIARQPNVVIDPLTMDLADVLTGFIYQIPLLIVTILVSVILTVRTVVLQILTVFAPFFLLAQVIPASRGFASQWARSFGRWALLAPMALLILYIGEKIVPHTEGAVTDDKFMLGVTIYTIVLLASVAIPLLIGRWVTVPSSAGHLTASRSKEGPGWLAKLRPSTGKNAPAPAKPPAPRTPNSAGKESLHAQPIKPDRVGPNHSVPGKAVRAYAEQMLRLPPAAKKRLAYAGAGLTKTGPDGYLAAADGKQIADDQGLPIKALPDHIYDEQGTDLGLLSKQEKALTGSRFATQAAFEDLKASGQAPPVLTQAYRDTARLMSGKPPVAAQSKQSGLPPEPEPTNKSRSDSGSHEPPPALADTNAKSREQQAMGAGAANVAASNNVLRKLFSRGSGPIEHK